MYLFIMYLLDTKKVINIPMIKSCPDVIAPIVLVLTYRQCWDNLNLTVYYVD